MKPDTLLINFVNHHSHPREIGRYWASDISRIMKGYLTPKDFFEPKPIDIRGARNIISGMAYEAQWKEVLEANEVKFKYGDEIKKEIKLTDDIVLVTKADFEMKEWILETKYPVRHTEGIPEKWVYQLEAEYRSYKKDVYLGIFSYPFDITYFLYKPSKEVWQTIKDILIKFDKKVRVIKGKVEGKIKGEKE